MQIFPHQSGVCVATVRSLASPKQCEFAEVKPGVLFKFHPGPVRKGSKESEQEGNLILKRNHVSKSQHWTELTRRCKHSQEVGRRLA